MRDYRLFEISWHGMIPDRRIDKNDEMYIAGDRLHKGMYRVIAKSKRMALTAFEEQHQKTWVKDLFIDSVEEKQIDMFIMAAGT